MGGLINVGGGLGAAGNRPSVLRPENAAVPHIDHGPWVPSPSPPLLAKLLSLSLFCQPLPFPISPQLLVCRASPLHSLQLGFHDVPLPHDHDVFSSIPPSSVVIVIASLLLPDSLDCLCYPCCTTIMHFADGTDRSSADLFM